MTQDDLADIELASVASCDSLRQVLSWGFGYRRRTSCSGHCVERLLGRAAQNWSAVQAHRVSLAPIIGFVARIMHSSSLWQLSAEGLWAAGVTCATCL